MNSLSRIPPSLAEPPLDGNLLFYWVATNSCSEPEKARTLNPDLIVMDLSMPVMNGIEAGSVLKAMLPQVPIVIYTAHDTSMIEPHAFAVGVRAVVQKHDMDGLAAHLHHLLLARPLQLV